MVEVVHNFITEEMEKRILETIPSKERKLNLLTENQTIRWGSKNPYPADVVSAHIPEVFDYFRPFFDFNSVTIKEYYAGQKIVYHIDRGRQPVMIVSLLSDATMKFRKRGEVKEVFLPRLSLCTFMGEERLLWEHSVEAIDKRYSIVFRNEN